MEISLSQLYEKVFRLLKSSLETKIYYNIAVLSYASINTLEATQHIKIAPYSNALRTILHQILQSPSAY